MDSPLATKVLIELLRTPIVLGYMKFALEQIEEHVKGVVTNRYGDAFIRGNNGVHILLSLQFRVNLLLGCRLI